MPNLPRAGNLYVKSFFATSVRAAMEQAQRELGPDALLLNTRESPPEARHLGPYEVVFGSYPEAAGGAAGASFSRTDDLHHRLHELREMILRIRPAGGLRTADEPGIAQVLIDAGVDSELASSVERGVRKRMIKGQVLDIARARATPELQAATIDELGSRFEVNPEIGRVTALVGPPGSGKTTTLVKLAINHCVKSGRPVRFISADNLRIGGADQLRTYAQILGAPFQAVESSVALAQAIESAPPTSWVFIDTPGFSAALQQDLGGDLAAFLSRRQDIDTHLVLTASLDRGERANTTDRFASFNPGKLIFTRLDETSSTATMFCEAARTQKPLSFLCHGQSIPEDIAPAAKDRIVDSLARQLPESLQAVA